MGDRIMIGLPRMRKEAGEQRDFPPRFVYDLRRRGASVLLEQDYGSGMGYSRHHYEKACPAVRFGSHEEVYQQEYVLVLRYPNQDELLLMRPGSCLISMIHYPTRPARIDFLRSKNLEALSLDSIQDDTGRRLIENLRAVGWNGMEIAFQTLRRTYPEPGFRSPFRPPIFVTLLGAGAVGSHVVQAAVRYGDERIRKQMVQRNVPGVRVTVVDYDLSGRELIMREILSRTDILADATQRSDPTRPVIPNDWIASLPSHAVILDLSVDPYDFTLTPPHVKGVEGVPQGNLDQYVFPPDDPAYHQLPKQVNTTHRRHAVSCYSWPGIHARDCMQIYGKQLRPIFRVMMEKGGIRNINPRGSFFERAIARGQLSRWGQKQIF